METPNVPYFVHEGAMTRMERINKRLWILIIILIVALVGTNVGWVIYESQFTDEEYSYEMQMDSADGGSNTYTDNIINMTGGDYYGENGG